MAIKVQTDRCIQPGIDGNSGSKTRACVPNGKKCQRSADKNHPKAKSWSTSTQIVIEEALRPTSIFADKLKNPKYDIFHFSVVERWGVWQLWVCEIPDVEGPCNFNNKSLLALLYPFSLVYSSCPRCFWEGGWQWQQERWRTLLGTRAEEVWTWRHTGHSSLLLLAWPPPSLQKEKNRETIHLTLLSKRDLGLDSVCKAEALQILKYKLKR